LKHITALTAITLALAACTPAPMSKPAEEAPTAAAITPPPAHMAETFKDCTWGEAKGGGVSVNLYSCEGIKYLSDETLPGILREYTAPDGKVYTSPIIQVFAKAPDAPIDAVLEAVRKASPGGEKCTFQDAPESFQGNGPKVYVFGPTGKDKEKFDAYVSGKGPDYMDPCGPLGPREAGFITFEIHPEAPAKVVTIFWPSDIAPWDPASVKVAP
jgi:hypothetical protein